MAVEIGRYAHGAPLVVDVAHLHTLISGLSGSGKRSTLRALLAGVARDPATQLVALDVKRVEFSVWRPRASVVAVEHEHITAALEALAGLIDARYRLLDAQGANAWTATPATPRVLVAVDELAGLVASGDRQRDRTNGTALRHVLERGRAAGVLCVAAIQRPAHDVLPTSIRDLFQARILHALADRVSVEMAAGAGWSTCPSHTIPTGPRHAGLAYVLLDGERQGQAARSYWITPQQAAEVAQRTAYLRHPWPLGDAPSPGPPRPTGPRADASPIAPHSTEATLDADETAVLAAVSADRTISARELPSHCRLPEGRARRAAQRLAERHLLSRSGSDWKAAR